MPKSDRPLALAMVRQFISTLYESTALTTPFWYAGNHKAENQLSGNNSLTCSSTKGTRQRPMSRSFSAAASPQVLYSLVIQMRLTLTEHQRNLEDPPASPAPSVRRVTCLHLTNLIIIIGRSGGLWGPNIAKNHWFYKVFGLGTKWCQMDLGEFGRF